MPVESAEWVRGFGSRSLKRRPSSPIFTAVGDDGMSDSLTRRLIGWQYQTIIMKVAMISELAVAKLAVESSSTISLPLYAYPAIHSIE